MQKTIGGDRLGSGNKMKVHLHGYERSTFNLNQTFKSTMSMGTLVPFLCIPMKPGDTFDIELFLEMNTHPTLGPLFASAKVELDLFLCPVRLYQAQLHNNALNVGRNMASVKLPQIELTARPFDRDDTSIDINNCQINPSCILKYLGISGIGHRNPVDGEGTRNFNAIPILAYWDIYKNYFANKQEEIGAVIHTPFQALVDNIGVIEILTNTGASFYTIPELPTTGAGGTPFDGYNLNIGYPGGTAPIPSQIILQTSLGDLRADEVFENFILNAGVSVRGTLKTQYNGGAITIYTYRLQTTQDAANGSPAVATFPLENLDIIRNQIIQWATPANPFLITDASPEPFKWLCEIAPDIPANILSSQEGLALKTYSSDLFNNWLKEEWIDEINAISAVSTAGDEFTIEALVLARKVYDMLNRIAISDGSYRSWIEVVHDVEFYTQCYSPVYMGGLIRELVFQEVVSNSAVSGEPLGSLAGKGILGEKKKGGNVVVRTNEHAYLIGIVSITPRIAYSQGNNWDTHLETMDDFHKPPMDGIGFQDSINEDRAWWDTSWVTTEWVQTSAGKIPAWINYQTAVDKVFGNFAIPDNEMYMVFNRRYEADAAGISDLTTYIDPVKYNFIFAQTSLDAQNYWCQIGTKITARRKMSANQIPNL